MGKKTKRKKIKRKKTLKRMKTFKRKKSQKGGGGASIAFQNKMEDHCHIVMIYLIKN